MSEAIPLSPLSESRRTYWREYRRAHPQAPRDRSAYDARRHAANRAAINAARRERYGIRIQNARFSRRKAAEWRASHERDVAARIEADREGQLHFAGTIPELVELIAAQERDARTFNIKRSPLFVSNGDAEKLFYGDYYRAVE